MIYDDDLRGERCPRRMFAATWRTWAASSASGRAAHVARGLAVAGTEADSTSSRVRPFAPEGGVSLETALRDGYWILLMHAPLCGVSLGIALRSWILLVRAPLWGRGRRQPRDRPLRRLLNPPRT